MSQQERKEKKIAIVGKAPASVFRAPFDDPDWEIWSLSDAYHTIPRWDRWFELHDVEYHRWIHPEHWKWLCTDHGKPLYLLGPHPDIPHAKIFPREELLAYRVNTPRGKRQPFQRGYVTNSGTWQIMLAIMEGATHIGVYGYDLAQHEEYAHQRPSAEWIIGVAEGLGIDVHIPDESDLMKCRRLYGYETHNGEMYAKTRARIDELTRRSAELQQQRDKAARERDMRMGAMTELKDLLNTNGDGPALPDRLQTRHAECQHLTEIEDECDKKLHILQGALENLHWTRQWC